MGLILQILTILVVIAGYVSTGSSTHHRLLTPLNSISLGQIRYLSLPIPSSTSIATLLLPILTGLGIQISQPFLTQSPKRNQSFPPWLLPSLIFILLTIYDTILATLATTDLVPSESQMCLLLTHWERMFHAHSAEELRRIQDTHQCCGLKTMRHMPWPFPDNHGADACRDMYRNRTASCLGAWRRDLRGNAGMVLVVAVVCFLVKVCFLSMDSCPLDRYG